jgi:hypothetical protein
MLVVLCGFGQWLSFHFTELKPYSGDSFWALLLLALAARASEAHTPKQRRDRILVWWGAAAAGQWLSYGAALVVPACAMVLAVQEIRRAGAAAIRWHAALALAWATVLAAHYVLVLRYAQGSEYLQAYWSFALAPAGADVWSRVTWAASQLAPFAIKPGGTTLPVLFWIAAAAGWLLRPWPLGLLCALITLSAFALAMLRLYPLYERLSLWMLPGVYLGIALLADGAIRIAREQRTGYAVGAAVAAVAAAAVLCANMIAISWQEMRLGRPADSNHALDDRAAVRWLAAQVRSGDLFVTTHYGLPALWWYGGVSLRDGGVPPGAFLAGFPIAVASYTADPDTCRAQRPEPMIAAHRRALVYLGFRFDDVPDFFDRLLLDTLSAGGRVVETRSFAASGIGVIVALSGGPGGGGGQPRNAGCITLQPARRW